MNSNWSNGVMKKLEYWSVGVVEYWNNRKR
jgi:hypothetical protein